MSQESISNKIIKNIATLRSSKPNENLTKERQWIIDHIASSQLKQAVTEISIVSLHILSALESGESTGIALAGKLNVTRGGITRATKKLIQLGLINTNKHPNDKKKIFYQLTDSGREIAHVHDSLHQQLEQYFEEELSGHYSKDELELINDFLLNVIQIEAKF